ncbi:LysR family transcriptional regulator [Anaerotignum lactatifermentans]|uniref:LysR family transcriptional regulator n=1 Tax=Anaerotignum lactatifermentans TaxID=160404 RepID=A0ABS2GBE1_9FIRM|nr:LysR family transcriptional regulator [Anaerotignum lactatifermentans]MBM6830265.1 LysR family transcriptional regulator [Anaerotignum lactatifermentans]MBM6878811.1 LysR family transcriptional regulator [Anaerotignum lactatifermentans]MBM6951878.1 LysR family transcriptional regulator [Anaerotignum lactatifermentans]
MYHPLLDTFIAVADCGSFTKASEILFISPTAVMKQMNTLEKHLELKLIDRTPSGIRLTQPGTIIYKEAKHMIDHSKKSIAKARAALYSYETTFCVGTSLLNPAKPFMDLWYLVNQDFPSYKLHLVPYEDDHNGILSEIEKLGEKFDFLIGVCDSKEWLSRCNFLPLGRYRKMVAVSREHPFAAKSSINIEALHGKTLMMVRRGDSAANDTIRNDLEKHHPEIHIEDTPQFYDLSVFNHCAETGNVLLTIECWRDVHPGLVSIPVNWDYSIPYGILYSPDAPKDVLQFIEAVKKIRHLT